MSMSPQYPNPEGIALTAKTGTTASQDAAAAQLRAWMDQLHLDRGMSVQEVVNRIFATGMADHEPLRSWVELWRRQTEDREHPLHGLRDVIVWFAGRMDQEMTRQAYARQDTDSLRMTLPPSSSMIDTGHPRPAGAGVPASGGRMPQMGVAAPGTVPLHLLHQGDPADRYRDTFFEALDRLKGEVDRLGDLFWGADPVDASAWVRQFCDAAAAVACQALRMARQASRYYGQRNRTRRAPY